MLGAAVKRLPALHSLKGSGVADDRSLAIDADYDTPSSAVVAVAKTNACTIAGIVHQECWTEDIAQTPTEKDGRAFDRIRVTSVRRHVIQPGRSPRCFHVEGTSRSNQLQSSKAWDRCS